MLAIVLLLQQRLISGIDGSNGDWFSVLANSRLPLSEDPSRTSLHVLGQDFALISVRVDSNGFRIFGGQRRAEKV